MNTDLCFVLGIKEGDVLIRLLSNLDTDMMRKWNLSERDIEIIFDIYCDMEDKIDKLIGGCGGEDLQFSLDALGKKCTKLEEDKEYNAELVVERDLKIADLETENIALRRRILLMNVISGLEKK